MIERHLTFNVLEGHAADFEALFATRYRPAMSKSPGFVDVRLLRELVQTGRYQMVLRFESVDAATGWRTSAEHQALQPDLNALHTGMDVAAYEVVG